MSTLDGDTVFDELLSGTLHRDIQVDGFSVALTAGRMYELEDRGELDFGGSEFQLGNRSEHEPVKRNEDDDYGWWSLSPGVHVVELNETLDLRDRHRAFLQPHYHLIWNGSQHPSLWMDRADSDMRLLLPLQVGEPGINIKENARVSSVRVSEIPGR